ncbi:cell envelope biogenesis protein TolA [Chelatococcus sp. SYSU_G07232]|uniref:Cell envelope biogenesis protein TolA n=1 Tax=Chelatococcus albus TaxID=3047466 RepID=A0ABT7AFT1_9HYPH|nr:cell envelope biogenesis protein TolA [Chelatococcus sp. SYSU_G07232]MDJ1158241.1 cell envelope biogenesis protein TolA [Chelatococcus sp. SYSU_G07232]
MTALRLPIRFSRQEPGLVVSGIGHAAILVAGLVAFASAPPFQDHEEAVAVDVVSESDLRAMTKGERTAKEVKPEPKPRADKLAEVAEEKPAPADSKRDVPTPPARREVQAPQEDKQAAPPQPPQRPEPPKQEAKAEPKPEPPRPDPPKEAEAKPEPPKRPEPPKPEEKPEPRKAEPKPEPRPEPKREDIAKLLEREKQEEAKKAAAKPVEPERKFNPADIAKLLESKDKAQSTGSTGREVNRTASLGTPTGNAPKLSLSQRDALGNLLKEQLASCWSPPMGAANANAKPQVRMKLNQDGSLMAEPVVANSSGDPAFRTLADSALRAVRRCAPFRIPPQYMPYYADWRDWNVTFDPKEFLG